MRLVVEGGGNCVPMYSNKCSEIGKCFWLSVVMLGVGCWCLLSVVFVGGSWLLLVCRVPVV